jgi:hypothetical protein
MAVAKKINDRKRAQVKARADSFIFGNRKERRAEKHAMLKAKVETPVTDGLKAKAKAKKVKDTPTETV